MDDAQKKFDPDTTSGPVREFIEDYEAIASTLGEIRSALDKIDQEIVDLLAIRATYVKDATRFKKDKEETSAPYRQAEVITKAKLHAATKDTGIDGFSELVEKVYKTMIPGFADLQQKLLKKTRILRKP